MSTLLDERAHEFLRESNAIEGITNIDHKRPENAHEGRGHVGAFLSCLAAAKARTRLSLELLCSWQRLLAEEQLRFGHKLPEQGIGRLRGPDCPLDVRVGSHVAPPHREVPGLFAQWLEQANARLSKLGPMTDAPQAVEALGDVFQAFEALHPFVDGNGRVGRLLLAYGALLAMRPYFVIRASERAEYYAAHQSKVAMRLFVAGKLREAILVPSGEVLLRASGDDGSGVYQAKDKKQRIIVEWHSLVAAEKAWKGGQAG